MSSNLEFYLWLFIDYCDTGENEGWNKRFKYKDERGYDYIYGGTYYQDRLEEYFDVN